LIPASIVVGKLSNETLNPSKLAEVRVVLVLKTKFLELCDSEVAVVLEPCG
jgi:hypothetical protein